MHRPRSAVLIAAVGVLSACSKGDNNTPPPDSAALPNASSPAVNADAAPTTTGSTASNATLGGRIANVPEKAGMLFVAKKPTLWSTEPAAPANPATGAIAAGDTVYFSLEPNDMASWQVARIRKLGVMRYVHPNDFKRP